ncbi:hypothetical protein [Psychrobacter sp. I-STPA10]|uniref:hypothetical protein n=1 Tax=Psychrobacter sp. I-STPA10 TaxID=2585769 RepID=UPI001E5700D6|nr:hypothetical protein [Psychrobacter sp. I-STPA10]
MNRMKTHQTTKNNHWLTQLDTLKLTLPLALALSLALPFGISSAMAAQSKIDVVVKPDKNNPKIEQVYVKSYKNGRLVEQNISQFKHPHHITTEVGDWLVSDDGRYAMFSHYDYPPNKIVVYDLKNNRRISEFKPEYAGDLRWTGNNLVVLTYGCGTMCGYMRIFNIKGMLLNEIWLSETSYSPDGKYVAMYPGSSMSGSRELRIYRFDPIKGVKQVFNREKFAGIPEEAYISNVKWLSNNRLTAEFEIPYYLLETDENGEIDESNQPKYEKVIQLPK